MEHRRYLTIQQRETLQQLLQGRAAALRDEAELREVQALLARVHEPDFGLCVDCEADIPYVRLQANPSATRCVACQPRTEQPRA